MKGLNDDFSKQAELKLLSGFVKAFNGEPKPVLEKIQKLFFFNSKTSTYKRVPPSIKKNVMELCEEYKSQ